MNETRVSYIVRFMYNNGAVGSETYYELSEAITAFDEVLRNNPIFADLDIKTVLNAKKFKRE